MPARLTLICTVLFCQLGTQRNGEGDDHAASPSERCAYRQVLKELPIVIGAEQECNNDADGGSASHRRRQ